MSGGVTYAAIMLAAGLGSEKLIAPEGVDARSSPGSAVPVALLVLTFSVSYPTSCV